MNDELSSPSQQDSQLDNEQAQELRPNKMHIRPQLTFSTFVQTTVATLIFVLGIVVGYRVIPQGSLPLIAPSSSNNGANVRYQVTNTQQPSEVKDVDFGQFWNVWDMLQKEYLDTDKINHQEMVYGAIKGMTAALGDPYTVYLPPKDDKRAAEELAGAFFGVGIELGYIENTLAVVAPLKGMPAEKAGVKAGDLILHVKDEAKKLDSDTTGWSLSEAVSNIRGEKGTSVWLTLLRRDEKSATQGARPFDVNLMRDEIVIPSVEVTFSDVSDKHVALVDLSRFGERTEQEWNGAVSQILARQPKVDVIALDMRNNPGGFFDRAIDIVSDFVQRGTVVTQKGKFASKDYKTNGTARLANYPLVILVNKGSASASEIVAGALRDLKKVKLVGEKTFGKGTVQDRRELPAGGGLHITIARWLLPSGGWIHHEGLPVDVEIKDNPDTKEDEVLQKAIEAVGTQTAKKD